MGCPDPRTAPDISHSGLALDASDGSPLQAHWETKSAYAYTRSQPKYAALYYLLCSHRTAQSRCA